MTREALDFVFEGTKKAVQEGRITALAKSDKGASSKKKKTCGVCGQPAKYVCLFF